jgi:hypothetical protein
MKGVRLDVGKDPANPVSVRYATFHHDLRTNLVPDQGFHDSVHRIDAGDLPRIRLWVVKTHCCSVHFGIRVASISSVMVVLFAFNGP